MTYNRLWNAVKEAWDSIGHYEFKELIASMPTRCQAVIDANGLFTNSTFISGLMAKGGSTLAMTVVVKLAAELVEVLGEKRELVKEVQGLQHHVSVIAKRILALETGVKGKGVEVKERQVRVEGERKEEVAEALRLGEEVLAQAVASRVVAVEAPEPSVAEPMAGSGWEKVKSRSASERRLTDQRRRNRGAIVKGMNVWRLSVVVKLPKGEVPLAHKPEVGYGRSRVGLEPLRGLRARSIPTGPKGVALNFMSYEQLRAFYNRLSGDAVNVGLTGFVLYRKR
ncbi:hypothetical protein HOY80DRAFT_1047200 [Tuber brumale]|nr:hypothetical protein HOY80DRAFT_1047200 [Tuber brumale]